MKAVNRQQARAALRWTATGLAIGFTLLLASNLVWRYRLNFTHRIGLRAYDGLLALGVEDASSPRTVGLYRDREVRPHIKLEFNSYRTATGWAVAVPIALPLGISAVGAALLWRLERIERWRAMRGHCPACGYDLQGLAGQSCPECGAAAVFGAPNAGTA